MSLQPVLVPGVIWNSPAWRVLSLSERRVLDRIAFEHSASPGRDRLQVSFQDFAQYGVERHSILPAVRVLLALGLVRMVGSFSFQTTWLGPPATHDCPRIPTLAHGRRLATTARGGSRGKSAARAPAAAPAAGGKSTLQRGAKFPPRSGGKSPLSPATTVSGGKSPPRDDPDDQLDRPLLRPRRLRSAP